MTEKEMMRHVNLEMLEPFTPNNPPPYYTPIFSNDVLVVLGKTGGVIIWPGSSTLIFSRVVECEGNYWVECDGPEPKTAIDLWDENKTLEVTMGFVKEHATYNYSEGTDEIISFSLPWNFE